MIGEESLSSCAGNPVQNTSISIGTPIDVVRRDDLSMRISWNNTWKSGRLRFELHDNVQETNAGAISLRRLQRVDPCLPDGLDGALSVEGYPSELRC